MRQHWDILWSRNKKLARTLRTSDIFKVLLLVLAIKLFLFWWGANTFNFAQYADQNWLSIWNRWDAQNYALIAQEGYGAPSAAPDLRAFLSHFPPAYPFAMLLVAAAFGIQVATAGMIVSWIAILAASYLLYRLVLLDFGSKHTAAYSVILLNIFPTSYFTIAPYAESLFLLLAIGSFFLLRKGAYRRSGALGALSTLTRLTGVALFFAYAAHLLKQLPWKKMLRKPRHFLDRFRKYLGETAMLFALALLGLLGYLGMNWIFYGSPLFFLDLFQFSQTAPKHLIIPGSETVSALNRILLDSFSLTWNNEFMMSLGWGALFTLIMVIGLILQIRQRMPIEYIAFTLGALLFYTSFSWGISNARYAFIIFPAYIAFAQIKNKALLHAAMTVSFILLMYFTKLFVSGWWTF